MKTENNWPHASISPAGIEAIVRRARAERAEAMRAELAALPAVLKRLLAHIRPTRHRVPQAGICS